jgi:hypothetical protein
MILRLVINITPNPATDCQREFGRKLMVFTKLRNLIPDQDECCRIKSVNTPDPGLWITATFLDGSVKSFRPEKIRPATVEEEQTVG